jgi:serine/threonine protein kinase
MTDPAPCPTPLQPGDLLDQRYQIIEEIGRGGFATVYRARHLALGRQVAIKHLHLIIDGQDHLLQERALREARALARIDHPHVVRVYDAHHGPGAWVALELLHGHTLDAELRARGPMTLARALALLLPCLGGLEAIHQQGIVHKDIKPANLFLAHPGTPHERLVLLDFSVAGLDLDTAPRLTGRFELVGTLQYMSPEYIADQRLSPATDIYQLGLTLAECLTGRPAVDAADPRECMMRHCHGALDLPSALREGPLGEVFAQALEPDPARRLPTAAALRDALAALPDLLSHAALHAPLDLTEAPAHNIHATRPHHVPPAPAATRRATRHAPRHALWGTALATIWLLACTSALAALWASQTLRSWSGEGDEAPTASSLHDATPETPALPQPRGRATR